VGAGWAGDAYQRRGSKLVPGDLKIFELFLMGFRKPCFARKMDGDNFQVTPVITALHW
jgi:hypothetical protein